MAAVTPGAAHRRPACSATCRTRQWRLGQRKPDRYVGRTTIRRCCATPGAQPLQHDLHPWRTGPRFSAGQQERSDHGAAARPLCPAARPIPSSRAARSPSTRGDSPQPNLDYIGFDTFQCPRTRKRCKSPHAFAGQNQGRLRCYSGVTAAGGAALVSADIVSRTELSSACVRRETQGLANTTRSRPPRLAAYSAVSARRSRSSS